MMTRHVLPVQDFSYSSLCIIVTWPYHRTLRYFTLDPAARLARDLDRHVDNLNHAVTHWREVKATEYDFVGAASTIAAVADIGIFSWTNIDNTYWVATAMFYFSLSLSLWGIIMAAQQRSVTRAISTLPHSPQQLRHTAEVILRSRLNPHGHDGEHTRRRSFAELNMLYVWQCPLMLMSYSWATLLIGLTLHVCAPLISDHASDGRKVAVFYLVTGIVLVLNFVWVSAWVCWTPGTEIDEEFGASWGPRDQRSPATTFSGDTKAPMGRIDEEHRTYPDHLRSKSV